MHILLRFVSNGMCAAGVEVTFFVHTLHPNIMYFCVYCICVCVYMHLDIMYMCIYCMCVYVYIYTYICIYIYRFAL